jgi:hypothetical protein
MWNKEQPSQYVFFVISCHLQLLALSFDTYLVIEVFLGPVPEKLTKTSFSRYSQMFSSHF